jgi:hypothetical protein
VIGDQALPQGIHTDPPDNGVHDVGGQADGRDPWSGGAGGVRPLA